MSVKVCKCTCEYCGYSWTGYYEFKPKYCSDQCNANDGGKRD